MTPSEKKARESLLSDASYLLKSVDHQYSCACETCRQSQVERVASALSEAERRGFERAKELATSLIMNDGYAITFQTMGQYRTAIAKNVRSLTHDEA